MKRPRKSDSDALLAACAAVLREVGDYPITAERLSAAAPLIRDIRAAIRTLDEVDVSGCEPVMIFRPIP